MANYKPILVGRPMFTVFSWVKHIKLGSPGKVDGDAVKAGVDMAIKWSKETQHRLPIGLVVNGRILDHTKMVLSESTDAKGVPVSSCAGCPYDQVWVEVTGQ